ncbi:MAG: bifunctional (p)ppGpp synthetase/guanosine-3',5'-bis(diphosphate) 3'-pyrophosphohydrolase [Cryomorphaceae bacterium]|nr:bifunctional (p)ppGpp synthetase/guanosine-3',5'-bis(diphosphate) 3'-pyrophosphohydrolase [Cryomorphaceae bacterium]
MSTSINSVVKNQEDSDAEEKKIILNRYRTLLRSTIRNFSEADKKLIRSAFDLAMDAHKDVRRKSGEPYILHPIEVAIIVSKEIGLGKTSIAAALMHDVVEDSDYTLEDIRRLFGDEIAKIIDGLTKISGIFDKDISVQAENFRKMLLTISDDIRVILIKLADRLHNMRTMESMQAHKQRKIASETLFLYAPLAHRFGLHNIKTELEDLSLKYTEPEVHREIEQKLQEERTDRTRYLKTFSSRVREQLNKAELQFTIKERTKSVYSIRKKMKEQKVPFEEIYDKFAIRIIVDSSPESERADCWRVYSIITKLYKPNPLRFRDWITNPKSNGYESLHITVMGPDGHWIEVQIRSRRMDEIAENGYAAHWKYKDDPAYSDELLEEWLNKVRELLEMKATSAIEFVDNFKLNLFSDEIFVFTPEGDMIRLPQGAFPLDFAYEIHTDIGNQTLGAKVNGKLVALSNKLQSGDQVEILTSKAQRPKQEWLQYSITAKARSNIKNALKIEKRKIVEEGEKSLMRKLTYIKVKSTPRLMQDMVRYFNLKNEEQLYEKVGKGLINNTHIKEFLRQNNNRFMGYLRKRFRRSGKQMLDDHEENKENLVLQFGKNSEKMDYKLAHCCSPIPGDEVFGYRASSGALNVHRTDCPNALSLQSKFANRIVTAEWLLEKTQDNIVILVLRGIDTVGLINKVTQIISNQLHVNIKSINIAGNAGIFEGIITVIVEDKMHLNQVVEQLKQVEGITSVERRFKNR